MALPARLEIVHNPYEMLFEEETKPELTGLPKAWPASQRCQCYDRRFYNGLPQG